MLKYYMYKYALYSNITIEEAVEMIKSGQIKDVKTIIAVMMAANERLIQNHGQMRK
ncbi:MAG: hypothetical protein ACYCYE_01595 [Clostridia bacterium]